MGPLQTKELRGSAERSAIKEGWAATQQWAEQVASLLMPLLYICYLLLPACAKLGYPVNVGGAMSERVLSV